MAYTKQTWANGSGGGTPISAARLQYIEDGLEDAADVADAGSLPTQTGNSGKFLTTNGTAASWGTPAGSGDASTNTASSVDSEIAVFSGTAGKTLKRATTTGILKGTSGVIGAAAAGTDYYAPGSTDVAITDGGTGVSTLPAGLLKGAGTGAITAAAAGTDYYAPSSTDVAVADGGTGRSTSTTAYGLLAAGTTAAGVQQTLPAGATTEMLVGGGSSALPVWTAATGSGTPVRATSPTLVTPILGTPASGTLTSCTGLPITGIAASTSTALGVGSVELGHATDTTVTRMEAGLIGVEGIYIPTITGAKRIAVVSTIPGSPDPNTVYIVNDAGSPRVTTITSSATPAINTDACDMVTITALAAAITSMTSSLTGTPHDGQTLMIRIKDNATARAITWGASFVSSGVATLLATTVISKVHTIGLVYDAVVAKWVCLAVDATGY